MDFAHLGPIQMIIVGFDEDADYQGLILDELERLSCRGLIRVIDLKFFFKETNDQLLSLELTELTDTEIAEYGAVINGLLGLSALHSEQAHTDALDAYDHSFGLTPDDIKRIASELEPGEAVGMLLFEHVWAARLKQAIRLTGGYPIAQGLLTPEALMKQAPCEKRNKQQMMLKMLSMKPSLRLRGLLADLVYRLPYSNSDHTHQVKQPM